MCGLQARTLCAIQKNFVYNYTKYFGEMLYLKKWYAKLSLIAQLKLGKRSWASADLL